MPRALPIALAALALASSFPFDSLAAPAVASAPVSVPQRPRTIHDPRSCDVSGPLPSTGKWTEIPLPDVQGFSNVALAGGIVYAISNKGEQNAVLAIDPVKGTFRRFDAAVLAGPPERERRPLPNFLCIGGELVLWGGGDWVPVGWGVIYNPARDEWRRIPARGAPSSSFSATDGERLFVFEPSKRSMSGASFDPIKNRWLPMSMGPALGTRLMAETQFIDGKFWLFGCNVKRYPMHWKDCLLGSYDPRSDRWDEPRAVPSWLAAEDYVVWAESVVVGKTLAFVIRSASGDSMQPFEAGRGWLPKERSPSPDYDSLRVAGGSAEALVWTIRWWIPGMRELDHRRVRFSADLTRSEIPPPLPSSDFGTTEDEVLLLPRGILLVINRRDEEGHRNSQLWIWR